MKLLSRTTSIFLVIVLSQISVQSFSAQNMVSTAAPDAWRDTPRNPATEIDPVPPEVRQKRDLYMSQLLAQLVSPPGYSGGCLIGSWLVGSTSEFGRIKGDAWIIGTFADFNVFPTIALQGATYTEIYVRVDHVIAQPSGTTLSAEQVIDTVVAGGAVERPGKPPLFFMHCPNKYSPQPGHKYLMQIFYNPETLSYSADWRWDLTDGTVRPNSEPDAWRAANGKSAIDGTSASDVGQRVRQIFTSLPKDAGKHN